jgi:Centromere protein H (CENP-H)
MSLARLSSQVLSAENELTKAESEHTVMAHENAVMATRMLSLADAARAQKGDISDPKLRARVNELEAAMRASRQRWRILKGTASAAIAGSGVDWARDPHLLEIVMDDDDDDDD